MRCMGGKQEQTFDTGEKKMGSVSNESFDQFLDSLKEAGVEISNERELRERLAEAQRWRFAFATLAANGRQLGIRFQDARSGVSDADIHRAFARFEFPAKLESSFAASLRADH
ncbi:MULTISPECIES: hypothetical protein [unclassified Candidatus Accumulibacter]|jgi:hypothetical protein|nr:MULTISPECIES: hypothetical protein [unclassified Candidatus Accumulibacter]HRE69123.1 hypothetical protein [Accumulibacter sp.]HRE84990.1 hypothetical protein [Accumulibacter sp.]